MSDGKITERESDGFTFRYYTSDGGRHYTHYECERRLEAGKWGLFRWFSRTLRTRTTSGDAEQDRHDLERLRWVVDDIAEWAASVQRELDRLEGVDRRVERIAALRRIEGRTPEEAATYLEKAEQLESGRRVTA